MDVPSPIRHVVVVCHGFLSTADRAHVVARSIQSSHASVRVVVSSCNTGAYKSFFTTTDGIDVCGARVAAEVLGILEANIDVTQLSLVGLSAGGLYARAALPAIVAGARPGLSLVNFVTLATPHAGARGHLSPWLEMIASTGILGSTLTQMVQRDTPAPRDGCGPQPLTFLQWMAHPASPHAHALRLFARRIILASLAGDDKVPHWSAALVHDVRVLPSLAGASAGDGSGAARVVQLPAPNRGTFPHVVAAYEQGASTPDADEGGAAVVLPSSHWAWTFARPCSSGAVEPVSTPGLTELAITAHLRSLGAWYNVDVSFPEPPQWAVHRRAATGQPEELAGDAPRFVFSNLFLAP